VAPTAVVRVLPIACVLACGRIGFDGELAGDAQRLIDVPPGASYRDTVLASAPRMYYRLDETSGTVAADSSGNALDALYDAQQGGVITYAQPGAVAGDPATTVAGDGNIGPNVVASIVFNPLNMSWAGDFSVEVFVAPHASPPAGSSAAIFVCEAYMTSGLRVGWDHQNALQAWTTEAGGTSTLTASVPVVFDTFQHVVVVHQGSSMSLYVDGTVVGSDGAFDYMAVAGNSAECGIGAFHGMPSYATFDELAIYDRALPAAEIAAHLAHR
jgi:hypothetical protein